MRRLSPERLRISDRASRPRAREPRGLVAEGNHCWLRSLTAIKRIDIEKNGDGMRGAIGCRGGPRQVVTGRESRSRSLMMAGVKKVNLRVTPFCRNS